MDKNQNDNRNQENESMLKEKTNEDFNNQKPTVKDVNQKKNEQAGEEDESKIINREVSAKKSNMPADLNNGSEGSDSKTAESDNENDSNESREEKADSMRNENRKEKQDSTKGRF